MTKLNRKRLRNSRPKAFPGEAIVAAGIGAAASIAGAAMNAAATKNAAQKQADSIKLSAKEQAEALSRQSDIATQNQEKQISFTKGQNERNRDLQKEIQMNLQLLTGQQNENERLEATKIQVKNGGSMRKRLRSAKTNNTSLLRGRNDNLSFQVTDGGGVIPIGITPEGYELYELVGNDHEHYHTTKNGKNKTGVGIKFSDGNFQTLKGKKTNVIEGEGNQNSNLGELMLVTPTDAKFISKHTMQGYNPAKAVLNGQDPEEAFAIQEEIKNLYGISDDGKKKSNSHVRKLRYAGGTNFVTINPDLSLDYLAPVATGVVAGTMNRNKAKCGKRLRCGGRAKAAYGFSYIKPPYGSEDWWATKGDYTVYNPRYGYLNGTSDVVSKENDSTTVIPKSSLTTSQGNLIGAGISAGTNLLAAGIGNIGNTIAARSLAQAYGDAGRILTDAYGNLRTIDMNTLDRRNFRSAHAMAAIRTPYVNTAPELALIDRSLQRKYSNINRYGLNGAATLNRLSRAEADAYDMRSQVFAAAEKQREAIRQENAQRITQVANANADRDAQANREYTNAYLGLLQYNNDIENERITGAAQARVDSLTQRSSVLANMRATNAQSLASAINVGGNSFAGAMATNAKMQNELEMSKYGWTSEQLLNYTIDTHDIRRARILYARYKEQPDKYGVWAEELIREFGKHNLE